MKFDEYSQGCVCAGHSYRKKLVWWWTHSWFDIIFHRKNWPSRKVQTHEEPPWKTLWDVTSFVAGYRAHAAGRSRLGWVLNQESKFRPIFYSAISASLVVPEHLQLHWWLKSVTFCSAPFWRRFPHFTVVFVCYVCYSTWRRGMRGLFHAFPSPISMVVPNLYFTFFYEAQAILKYRGLIFAFYCYCLRRSCGARESRETGSAYHPLQRSFIPKCSVGCMQFEDSKNRWPQNQQVCLSRLRLHRFGKLFGLNLPIANQFFGVLWFQAPSFILHKSDGCVRFERSWSWSMLVFCNSASLQVSHSYDITAVDDYERDFNSKVSNHIGNGKSFVSVRNWRLEMWYDSIVWGLQPLWFAAQHARVQRKCSEMTFAQVPFAWTWCFILFQGYFLVRDRSTPQ